MSGPTQDDDLPTTFVIRLNQALMVSRLHDLSNIALEAPVAELRSVIARAIDTQGLASVKVDPTAEVVFVNDLALHARRQSAASLAGILAQFAALGISEMRFSRAASDAEVRAALGVLKDRAAGGDAALTCRRVASGLASAGLKGVVDVVPAEQAAQAVTKKAQLDEKTLVRLAYARTIALMREHAQAGRDDELRRYLWRKLTRAVQGLCSLATKEATARELVGLTTVKDADEHVYNHAVNTCLLSILLGKRLGLPRTQLAHAGLAGLLCGLGKMRTAPAIANKVEGRRTPAEAKEYGRHPYRGLGAILEARRMDDNSLAAALVAFQHDARPEYPRTRRPIQELHPLAQLVGVCETYDELTSSRPGQISLVPHDAIQMMCDGKPRPFDGTLVRLLGEVLAPPSALGPKPADGSMSSIARLANPEAIAELLDDDDD